MRKVLAGLVFALITSISCTIEKTDSRIDTTKNVVDLKNEHTQPELFPITEILNDESFHNIVCVRYSNIRHSIFIAYNNEERFGIIEQRDINNGRLQHTYDLGFENEVTSMLIVNDASSKMIVFYENWKNSKKYEHSSIIDYNKTVIESSFELNLEYDSSLEFSDCGKYIITENKYIYDLNGNKINTDEINIKNLILEKKQYSLTDTNEYPLRKPSIYLIKDVTTHKEITRQKLGFLILHGVSKNGKFFFIADTEYIVVIDIESGEEVFRYKSDIDLDYEIRSATFDKERNRILFVEWLEDDYSPIKAVQLPD